MSGPLSVAVTVAGLWASEPVTKAAFVGIGFIALIVSSYLVWKAERIKVLELEGKLPDGFEYHFANVRVADAPTVVSLFDGPERSKLMTLLAGGLIQTWARPSSSLRHDLVPLLQSVWETHILNFHAKGDDAGQINQTFVKGGVARFVGAVLEATGAFAGALAALPSSSSSVASPKTAERA